MHLNSKCISTIQVHATLLNLPFKNRCICLRLNMLGGRWTEECCIHSMKYLLGIYNYRTAYMKPPWYRTAIPAFNSGGRWDTIDKFSCLVATTFNTVCLYASLRTSWIVTLRACLCLSTIIISIHPWIKDTWISNTNLQLEDCTMATVSDGIQKAEENSPRSYCVLNCCCKIAKGYLSLV